jgi:hypothetical protein
MENKKNNYVYIDGANLHKGVGSLGWKLDYARFRVWLTEKYNVEKAYIFIGLIPKYKYLYEHLQEAGFILVFKETIYDDKGKPKGNCDADLVLKAVVDVFEGENDKSVIVASDGDYSGMVKFLQERNKLLTILSPRGEKNCSILLKRTGAKISYLNDQKSILKLSIKEKAPDGDGTP